MTAQDEIILNHPVTVVFAILEGIIFFIWACWGSKKLRQIYGKPFRKIKAFCISFFIWLTHAILSFVITYIGTEKTGYATPKLSAFLLIWWAYSNLREQYLKNCFYATGTPSEREYFANILDITLTMSRDEIIKKYVSRKKNALTPEEQQIVELAYTFFIEPKKYEKLVKDQKQSGNDTLNAVILTSSSKIISDKQSISISPEPTQKMNQNTINNAEIMGDSNIHLAYNKKSSDVLLSHEDKEENNSNKKEKTISSFEKITTTSKTFNTHNSDKIKIISIISIIIILIGISFWVGYDEVRNKNQNADTIKNNERLEDIVLLAEKHIANKYTTPLSKKMITEKLEQILNEHINDYQKIEIIKEKILKDNTDINNDTISKYFNKIDNEIISNTDEATSLCNAGIRLLKGREVSKDVKLAFECFYKAANMGNARAQAHLGECYIWGIGTEKSENDAILWIKQSAGQGDAMGERLLAWSYDMGMGVIQDDKQAFNLYQQAANHGDEEALDKLAFYYTIGKGTSINPYKAFECYKILAEKGNSAGICELGKCYLFGYGTTKNESEAFRLFMLAVEKGEPYGFYSLGYCYYCGISTQVNYYLAFKCFSIAANNNYIAAYDWLGLCYANGQGVEQDSKMAFSWYMKAANMKDKGGEFHVGVSYYYGQGVEKNEQEAIKWLKIAAKHGEQNAQKMLSRLNINYE